MDLTIQVLLMKWLAQKYILLCAFKLRGGRGRSHACMVHNNNNNVLFVVVVYNRSDRCMWARVRWHVVGWRIRLVGYVYTPTPTYNDDDKDKYIICTSLATIMHKAVYHSFNIQLWTLCTLSKSHLTPVAFAPIYYPTNNLTRVFTHIDGGRWRVLNWVKFHFVLLLDERWCYT